jgi:hypothetical protein
MCRVLRVERLVVRKKTFEIQFFMTSSFLAATNSRSFDEQWLQEIKNRKINDRNRAVLL